jgi:hypothetical protein
MMKYLLSIVTLICSAGVASSQYIEITCDKPVLIYNDHVGNEWTHALELNGKYLSIYKPIRIESSSIHKVKFVTSEVNEKYPDSSSMPLGIDASKLEWNKMYSKRIELIVRESNGRYAGNTAKWQVTIHYKKNQDRT